MHYYQSFDEVCVFFGSFFIHANYQNAVNVMKFRSSYVFRKNYYQENLSLGAGALTIPPRVTSKPRVTSFPPCKGYYLHAWFKFFL